MASIIAAPLVGYLSDKYSLTVGVNLMIPANSLAALVWFLGYLYLKPMEDVEKSVEEDETKERLELMREIMKEKAVATTDNVVAYNKEVLVDSASLPMTITVAV
jgi:hypothetical protein